MQRCQRALTGLASHAEVNGRVILGLSGTMPGSNRARPWPDRCRIGQCEHARTARCARRPARAPPVRSCPAPFWKAALRLAYQPALKAAKRYGSAS